VELLDAGNKAIGLANHVPVLVGAPPAAVEGLTAEVSEKGVVLRWNPESSVAAMTEISILFRRTEEHSPAPTEALRDRPDSLARRAEVDLSTKNESESLIDRDIHKGTTYQYRAQRIFRTVVDGQTLEMVGQLSPEVQVDLPNEPHESKKNSDH
jgi:hypothetical protein